MARAVDREYSVALQRAARGAKTASADALRALGVHIGQNFLLDQLWQQDALSTGELARRLEVEVPTITRMTQRMEAAGLVTRVRDETDRRVVRIELTDLGRSLRTRVPEALDAVSARALEGLSDEECRQLIRLLEHVAGNLRA
ncbi:MULTISPECIES: MarR family winged helix-turn-helix transcriptional regulator [Dactylosporangium]|nr:MULTISPECIES: MarR family transcriptional regulator [Dactylosporangium]UAB93412.1 MarR family transcriptional regulator [Dactylosporangium vinaceum]UWZ41791.1 MarR family transcriptional regulator [Dactylosporangium matsuzakiense]